MANNYEKYARRVVTAMLERQEKFAMPNAHILREMKARGFAMSTTSLQRLVDGERKLGLGESVALCEILDVSLTDVLGAE